jgi:hypothetical protein
LLGIVELLFDERGAPPSLIGLIDSDGIPFLVAEDFVLDFGYPPVILREPFRLPLLLRSVRWIMRLPFPLLLDSFKLELCYLTGFRLAVSEFLIVTYELSDYSCLP